MSLFGGTGRFLGGVAAGAVLVAGASFAQDYRGGGTGGGGSGGGAASGGQTLVVQGRFSFLQGKDGDIVALFDNQGGLYHERITTATVRHWDLVHSRFWTTKLDNAPPASEEPAEKKPAEPGKPGEQPQQQPPPK